MNNERRAIWGVAAAGVLLEIVAPLIIATSTACGAVSALWLLVAGMLLGFASMSVCAWVRINDKATTWRMLIPGGVVALVPVAIAWIVGSACADKWWP